MIALTASLVACGEGGEESDEAAVPVEAGMAETTEYSEAELRVLHARIIERTPGSDDLDSTSRGVAEACFMDPRGELCRWGRANLGGRQGARVQEAVQELQRRSQENEELVAACRRGDIEWLRTTYPGHWSFYQLVASPRRFEPRPVDAVVAIGISGSVARNCNHVQTNGADTRHRLKLLNI